MYAGREPHFENSVRIVIHQRGQPQMCHGARRTEANTGARLCVEQDEEVCHEDTSEAVECVPSRDSTVAYLEQYAQKRNRE